MSSPQIVSGTRSTSADAAPHPLQILAFASGVSLLYSSLLLSFMSPSQFIMIPVWIFEVAAPYAPDTLPKFPKFFVVFCFCQVHAILKEIQINGKSPVMFTVSRMTVGCVGVPECNLISSYNSKPEKYAYHVCELALFLS